MRKSLTLEQAKKILKKHYEKQLDIAKKSGSERDVKRVLQKEKHSYEVLDTGNELMEKGKEIFNFDDKIKETARAALLLHDVARFYEIGEKQLEGISHGIYGAENILRDLEEVEDPLILLPVKYHDKIDFSGLSEEIEDLGGDKCLITLMSKLVKDSDKVANFRLFARSRRKDFSRKSRILNLSEEVLRNFELGKLTDKKCSKTIFDDNLNFISWGFDLFFDMSKRIIVEEKIIKALLENFRDWIEEVAIEQAGVIEGKEVERQKEVLYNNLAEIEKILTLKHLLS